MSAEPSGRLFERMCKFGPAATVPCTLLAGCMPNRQIAEIGTRTSIPDRSAALGIPVTRPVG